MPSDSADITRRWWRKLSKFKQVETSVLAAVPTATSQVESARQHIKLLPGFHAILRKKIDILHLAKITSRPSCGSVFDPCQTYKLGTLNEKGNYFGKKSHRGRACCRAHFRYSGSISGPGPARDPKKRGRLAFRRVQSHVASGGQHAPGPLWGCRCVERHVCLLRRWLLIHQWAKSDVPLSL